MLSVVYVCTWCMLSAVVVYRIYRQGKRDILWTSSRCPATSLRTDSGTLQSVRISHCVCVCVIMLYDLTKVRLDPKYCRTVNVVRKITCPCIVAASPMLALALSTVLWNNFDVIAVYNTLKPSKPMCAHAFSRNETATANCQHDNYSKNSMYVGTEHVWEYTIHQSYLWRWWNNCVLLKWVQVTMAKCWRCW